MTDENMEQLFAHIRAFEWDEQKREASSVRSVARTAASSRRGERGAMKEKNITVVSRDDRRRGKTDWEKFHNLTDEEIEAGMAKDPVWADFNEADWSEAVLVIPPKKQAISIRIDEDVLDYFKQAGPGYQRRMNAVLRSFMEQTRKKPRKKRA